MLLSRGLTQQQALEYLAELKKLDQSHVEESRNTEDEVNIESDVTDHESDDGNFVVSTESESSKSDNFEKYSNDEQDTIANEETANDGTTKSKVFDQNQGIYERDLKILPDVSKIGGINETVQKNKQMHAKTETGSTSTKEKNLYSHDQNKTMKDIINLNGDNNKIRDAAKKPEIALNTKPNKDNNFKVVTYNKNRMKKNKTTLGSSTTETDLTAVLSRRNILMSRLMPETTIAQVKNHVNRHNIKILEIEKIHIQTKSILAFKITIGSNDMDNIYIWPKYTIVRPYREKKNFQAEERSKDPV
ncbi:hypothetical protein FQR65_LT04767 [Abscondita terminalis]|nr:hypothetical protein FQR65_LT04767 [Abscondita terminalis]